MTATILDGKKISKKLRKDIKASVQAMKENGERLPCLAVILAGDDEASHLYVSNKRKACEAVGIISQIFYVRADISTKELIELIDELNHDSNVDGILVQLPLSESINTHAILERIAIYKDVDGFHPYNVGRLALRNPLFRPCTPKGIIELLNAYELSSKSKHAVVIGASNIVGRPMSLEFLKEGATVTICHRFTKNLENHIRIADIIVSATGVKNLINPEWLSQKQIIIDVGMHRENNIVSGDIFFEEARQKVAWITPVPGGVGPMTITALLQNTMMARHFSNAEKPCHQVNHLNKNIK